MIRGRAVVFVVSTLAAVGLAAQQLPPAAQPPAFKSRVTVVPVDVRVVDRNGNPVKDLKQDDFTILEDGAPQRIVQFSFEELSAAPAGPAAEPLAFRKPLGETVTPQGRRIFLIVLGRGRQTGPVKAIQAAKTFISSRLLPQDQVALLAYNRSTDFTVEHARVIETLDRYAQKHEAIEGKLRQHFSGLAAEYGLQGKEIPASIQKEIDAVFRAPGALASRSTASTQVTDGAQIADDTRRDADRIRRAAEAAERKAAGMETPFDDSLINEAGLLDIPLDEYVEKSAETSHDLGNLYAGIRYLRYLEGEKHLVFLTPNGLFLPRLENSNSIAALANDARVTVDIMHTGGMAGGAAPRPMPPQISARAAAAISLNSATPSSSLAAHFRILRYDVRGHGASEVTPGDYSIAQLGRDALALADALGIAQFAFCGLSLGGMLAQWIAVNAPDRVTAVVLANTSARADGPGMETRRKTVLSEGMSAVADTVMGRFFSARSLASGGPLVATARRVLLATDPVGYAGCCAAIRDMDLRATLPQIKAPTLIISDDVDVSLPWTGHGEVLARHIPHSRVVHLPAAHLSNLELPRSFSRALLDFLVPRESYAVEAGMRVRRAVLGDAHVDRASADPISPDFQELITRYAWGTIWTRPGLDVRTRRLLVLTTMVALGRWEEFRLHLRTGLAHELEWCDVEEILLQTAVYAGVPVANTAFHIAAEETARPADAAEETARPADGAAGSSGPPPPGR